MSDQASVFEQTPPQSVTPDVTATPELNALADQLKTITNADGNQKYDSLPKALEGLANSQTYIPELQGKLTTVEAENAALKEKLAKTEAVEDVVSRLTQNQQAAPVEVTPQPSGLDENAVIKLLEQVTTQKAVLAAESANEQKVSDALLEAFGDKAGEVMAAKAAELNTSIEALQKQSRENPQLVLAAFNQQPTQTGPTTGSVNIPRIQAPQPDRVAAPEKSVLTGATAKEQTDFMDKIREQVWRDNGITG